MNSTSNYKIGSKVIVSFGSYKNYKGKIIEVERDRISVEFECEIPFRHSCEGSGRSYHCRYFFVSEADENITLQEKLRGNEANNQSITQVKLVMAEDHYSSRITPRNSYFIV